MADYEYVIEPLNGVDEFTPPGGWAVHTPGVVVPVLNMPMKVTVTFPVAFPMSGNKLVLYQCGSVDDPVTAPHEEICVVFTNFDGASAPKEFVVDIIPTKPCLRVLTSTPSSVNWGAVLAKAAYDVMTEQAYNLLMDAKGKLDKQLATLGKQATQLQEKMTQGTAEQAEIEQAMILYTNFLSDDIALYEALNP